MAGKVYLVGAGPGDPDLLTIKAHKILNRADVVLHDDLVSQQILAVASPSARIQSVGKRCGHKSTTQVEIHASMVAYAKANLTVVRLKAGDPFIFGRVGEEMEALRLGGVDFEIIPGVTAGLAGAAAAKIPLTDRRLASKVLFLTHHVCSDRALQSSGDLPLGDGTIVVYMPSTDYEGLVKRLVARGLHTATPCVMVSNASLAQQQVYRTMLGGLVTAPRLGCRKRV